MRLKNWLNEEASSDIDEQLIEIKSGKGEWEQFLYNILIGKDTQFNIEGSGHFRYNVSKDIPADIKRKYPDVIFALQALQLHVSGTSYYDKWNEMKSFITFKDTPKQIKVFRFWYDKNKKMINDLKSGKNIKLQPKSIYSSYTLNQKLFKNEYSTISTEEVIMTNGRGTFLVTSHNIIPVFNIFKFYLHITKKIKQIYGIESPALKILKDYKHEREIIGPVISEIISKDVVGYYENGSFNELDSEDFEFTYNNKKYIINNAELKTILSKYNESNVNFVYSTRSNSYIFCGDPNGRYATAYPVKYALVKEFKDVFGLDIYFGYWR